MFHFNRKHLEDLDTPMWVLKARGKSYYVNHVECSMPWSTKETPDNSHTKGSIKVRNCLLTIDSDNCAALRELTPEDQVRLRNQQLGITRIIVHSQDRHRLMEKLRDLEVRHGPIKSVGGGCGSTFYITDILREAEFSALALALLSTSFRELMPNEGYYKLYDRGKDGLDEHLWDDEEDDYED